MERKRFGIQIDDTGDLSIRGGGLSVGDTMAQNEYLLIMSSKGEIKEFPAVGAGISDMVGDTGSAEAKRKIREAFRADGITITSLSMTEEGTITRLEASYE